MARSGDGELALVELKAVDSNYPMLGEADARAAACRSPSCWPSATAPSARRPISTLLARLDLEARRPRHRRQRDLRRSAAWSTAEPDKLAGGVGLGPRFLISEAGLRATDLLQPGSLVRWIYRVKLPDGASDDRATAALIDRARARWRPRAGWEIRSRNNASPQLERTINRFTQFLTLVGLAALLVGGVGVANAVKSHIDRRRDVIASFKALGATGRDVFTIYLTQVMVLAAIGSVIGLALGAALPFVSRRPCSASCCRCRWCRRCISTNWRCPSSMASLDRARRSGCGRSAAVHDVPVGGAVPRGPSPATMATPALALSGADGAR